MKIKKKDLTKLISMIRAYWAKRGHDQGLLDALYAFGKEVSLEVFGNEYQMYAIKDTINILIGPFGVNRDATDNEVCNLFRYLGFEVI